MIETARVLVRMLDVGVSLQIASNFDQWLTRTQLQKFIYLLDVIGVVYDLLPPSEAHLTYKYGPYDAAIQNAVDSLSFRGLVAVRDVQRFGNTLSAKYQLTSEGQFWVQEITEKAFVSRWQAGHAVGRHVENLGWHRLVDLVYAEPTFVSRRRLGYGQSLPVNNGVDNSAAFFIASIERVLGHGFQLISIDRELVVSLFFRYLDEFDHIQASKGVTG